MPYGKWYAGNVKAFESVTTAYSFHFIDCAISVYRWRLTAKRSDAEANSGRPTMSVTVDSKPVCNTPVIPYLAADICDLGK